MNSTVRVRYHGSRTMNSLAMFYKDVTGIIAQCSEFLKVIVHILNILFLTKFNRKADYFLLHLNHSDGMC